MIQAPPARPPARKDLATRLPLLIGFLAVALAAGTVRTAAAANVPVPLRALPVGETLGERLARWSGDVRHSLGIGSRSLDIAHRQADPRALDEDFHWLMASAGYKLKEIESTIGLFPGLSLEFGQARERSEADREYLERALERHARRHSGLMPTLHRMIVAGIVEASEIEGFGVEKVKVTLLPIPSVRLTLASNDAPLSPATTRVLRANERLNQRLAAAAPG